MTRERVVYELENSIKLGISISREAREWLLDYLEQEPTPKDNLGVDAISRADAIKAMEDKAKKLTNEDTINGLCGAVAILYELPPITPQEPTDKIFTKADIDAIVKAINKGWELRVNEVLDKIRAEIEQLHLIGYATIDGKREIAKRAVIQVLDKYKAESEE